MSVEISKRQLWRMVNLKINRAIHHHHVYAVMNILFEEMLNDLKAGKAIKIANFGTLDLRVRIPRHFINVATKVEGMSKACNYLKLMLMRKIRVKLYDFLDLDKTFGPTIQ